ncbi:hypothetical protein ADK65_33620 [Streptomyces sp. NRRL B-1140]|nr:hypothetical protein ADK65_33620 [Streptomyces sp. NRRL B-1140]
MTAISTASEPICSRTITGSRRRSRMRATHMKIITMTNGAAARIVRFCRPVSASPWPLPTRSMIAATAPVTTPQNTTTKRPGSSAPFCDRVPMTMEAASAPETKKMPTRIITSRLVTVARGNCWSTPKSWPSGVASLLSCPSSCIFIAEPPKIANQIRLTVLGTRMTPPTNWRIVRPRLMRAMNMPTNGVQEIHHAQ